MLGKVFAHEVADVLRQLRSGWKTVFHDDECLDGLGSYRIGHPDSRRDDDGGMPHERILDLGWAYAVAATGDDVIGATLKPEISVLVADPKIAGDQPVAGIFVPRCLGIAPVFQHHHRIRPPKGDVAGCSGRQGLAGVVDDGGDMSRYWASDRTRLDRHNAGVRTEHQIALG